MKPWIRDIKELQIIMVSIVMAVKIIAVSQMLTGNST